MALTNAQRVEMNTNANPISQKVKLGDAIYSSPVLLTAEVTADASSTAVSFTIPFALQVIDVIVEARAASGSGTATVRSGTNAISDAIAMAVDTTIARAGTIDDAYSTLAVGDNLNVIANGSGDRGLITLVCRRL